ncbi:hypothetical protein P3G55_16605 [Leptospira sp. 96542]|nr:hypothetical protein [Leptospira sp. 96542]
MSIFLPHQADGDYVTMKETKLGNILFFKKWFRFLQKNIPIRSD